MKNVRNVYACFFVAGGLCVFVEWLCVYLDIMVVCPKACVEYQSDPSLSLSLAISISRCATIFKSVCLGFCENESFERRVCAQITIARSRNYVRFGVRGDCVGWVSIVSGFCWPHECFFFVFSFFGRTAKPGFCWAQSSRMRARSTNIENYVFRALSSTRGYVQL